MRVQELQKELLNKTNEALKITYAEYVEKLKAENYLLHVNKEGQLIVKSKDGTILNKESLYSVTPQFTFDQLTHSAAISKELRYFSISPGRVLKEIPHNEINFNSEVYTVYTPGIVELAKQNAIQSVELTINKLRNELIANTSRDKEEEIKES